VPLALGQWTSFGAWARSIVVGQWVPRTFLPHPLSAHSFNEKLDASNAYVRGLPICAAVLSGELASTTHAALMGYGFAVLSDFWCGKGSDQRCVSKVLPFCISQTLMTIGFVRAAECLRETSEPIWWRRVVRASGRITGTRRREAPRREGQPDPVSKNLSSGPRDNERKLEPLRRHPRTLF
jgi:hypothetical protein